MEFKKVPDLVLVNSKNRHTFFIIQQGVAVWQYNYSTSTKEKQMRNPHIYFKKKKES